jgi:hypothetical protein
VPAISGLEETSDGVSGPVELVERSQFGDPIEERSADVVLPDKATEVILPVEVIPAEDVNAAIAAPDVLAGTH